MSYSFPDEVERNLRELDSKFGEGEYPYLSQRQADYRNQKEISVNPATLDGLDFVGNRDGNYGTKGQARIFQKDRHKRGQRDTEI
jgi:hypothetical protein